MKRAVHAVLVLSMSAPLLVIYVSSVVAIALALLAHRVWPDANRGTCWSYALPRWWREGGYLAVRPALGVRMFGAGMVPHAIHVRDLGACQVSQTVPVRRYHGTLAVLRTWYFAYYIATTEPSKRGQWREV